MFTAWLLTRHIAWGLIQYSKYFSFYAFLCAEDWQIIKKVSLWRGANARNEDTNYWRAKLREALFNIPNTSPFTPSYVQKIGKKDPQMII